MDVATLWIRRPDSEIPELVAAWDGYSIEENYEGWEKACQRALDEVKGDLAAFRYLNISVSERVLNDAFRDYANLPVTDTGTFEGPEPNTGDVRSQEKELNDG